MSNDIHDDYRKGQRAQEGWVKPDLESAFGLEVKATTQCTCGSSRWQS